MEYSEGRKPTKKWATPLSPCQLKSRRETEEDWSFWEKKIRRGLMAVGICRLWRKRLGPNAVCLCQLEAFETGHWFWYFPTFCRFPTFSLFCILVDLNGKKAAEAKQKLDKEACLTTFWSSDTILTRARGADEDRFGKPYACSCASPSHHRRHHAVIICIF